MKRNDEEVDETRRGGEREWNEWVEECLHELSFELTKLIYCAVIGNGQFIHFRAN